MKSKFFTDGRIDIRTDIQVKRLPQSTILFLKISFENKPPYHVMHSRNFQGPSSSTIQIMMKKFNGKARYRKTPCRFWCCNKITEMCIFIHKICYPLLLREVQKFPYCLNMRILIVKSNVFWEGKTPLYLFSVRRRAYSAQFTLGE